MLSPITSDPFSVDENDLTSYMNYTGLRRGDSDFEGYISKGDLNENGLIDAYDISAVTPLPPAAPWQIAALSLSTAA